MRITTVLSLLILVFAMVAQHGSAQAAAGWRCEYAIETFGRNSRELVFSCYGKNLSDTRARARSRCRGLPRCQPGACLPINYSPRSSYER